MTEAVLIEIDGVDKTDKLLSEEPEAIHAKMRPHAEVYVPPPPGIHPYVPEQEEQQTMDALPPQYAGLMGAFHMPAAEE